MNISQIQNQLQNEMQKLMHFDFSKLSYTYLSNISDGFAYTSIYFVVLGVYFLLNIVLVIFVSRREGGVGPIYRNIKKFSYLNIVTIFLSSAIIYLRLQNAGTFADRYWIYVVSLIFILNLIVLIVYVVFFLKGDLEKFEEAKLRTKFN